MRTELRLCALLLLALAGAVAGDRAKAWLDVPMPTAVAADAPTAFDVPGIPILRPAPAPWHPRHGDAA